MDQQINEPAPSHQSGEDIVKGANNTDQLDKLNENAAGDGVETNKLGATPGTGDQNSEASLQSHQTDTSSDAPANHMDSMDKGETGEGKSNPD